MISAKYFLSSGKGLEARNLNPNKNKNEEFKNPRTRLNLHKIKKFSDLNKILQNTIKPYSEEAFEAIHKIYKASKIFNFQVSQNSLIISLTSKVISKSAEFRLSNGLRIVFQKEKSIIIIDFSAYQENLTESKKTKLNKILLSKDFTDKTKKISYKSDDGLTIISAGRSSKYKNMDVIQVVLFDLDGLYQADETEMRDSDTAKYIVRILSRYIDDQQMFIRKALEYGLRISNVNNFYSPISMYHGNPMFWGYMRHPDPMLDRHPHTKAPKTWNRPLPHGSLDRPGKVPGSVDVKNPEPLPDVTDIPAVDVIPSLGLIDAGGNVTNTAPSANTEDLLLSLSGKKRRKGR